MTFISYAQNFEDVMLWRALAGVERGRYLDIGAQDPVIDSVSKAFYDAGWRGWHVEPTVMYSEALRLARPDETVLAAAIGNGELLNFHEFPETGLSTMQSAIAEAHVRSGFNEVERSVPVVSLAAVLEEMAVGGDIHWMKVDVEGAEQAVLDSWRDCAVRPWVLVIESTLPRSPTPMYEDWEPLVLARGYRFAYFDGLNRFYVSESHLDLLERFAVPPNVFDDFALNGTASQPFVALLRAQVERLARESEQIGAEANALRSALQEKEAQVAREIASGQAPLLQAIEFLRSENERREEALVHLRQSLQQSDAKESAERSRLHEAIAFLQSENERRELALVEYRKLLESAGAAESAERGQLLETVAFLQAENERREAALVEHRRQLEEAGGQASGERGRLLETVAFLQAENERREEALVDYRRQLEEVGVQMAGELSRLLETVAFLQAENERREAALVEHRRQLEEISSHSSSERNRLLEAIAHLQARNEQLEMQGAEHRAHLNEAARIDSSERSRLLQALEFLRDENDRREAALVVERAAHENMRAEALRLQAGISALHASTSWRLTKPLRAAKRLSRVGSRACAVAAYQCLRWPARACRPMLRGVARWGWLRHAVVKVIGKNSLLINKGRLFLFGSVAGAPQEASQPIALETLDWQAARIYRLTQRITGKK
ncbi:FkbM family methyltransferase [Pseudoxanthomonas sp. X-1]|uniref:FkbM family methyltransferase n=1 Tax=Pseudoxanthomonas sp. X-1 TaxID=2571115 RepID=UPI00110AABA9|nr:FkbM family methyltransferase [Pseudoxanthomonas sp. X-1]TMN19317.1 FkbM family methyltransferase [Pseudoxanthomonas sp. X-1]UAY74175.1 FkbM family methyltransferase [Pseudoxanthomonas sp. X-1]